MLSVGNIISEEAPGAPGGSLSVTVSVSILSSKLGAVTVSVSILSSKLEAGLSLGGAYACCVWDMVVSVLWARAMWLEKAVATVRPNFFSNFSKGEKRAYCDDWCSAFECLQMSLALMRMPLGTFGERAVAAAMAACGRFVSKSEACRGVASVPYKKRRKSPCVDPPGRIGIGINAMFLVLMS